jgi:hypothetical protein
MTTSANRNLWDRIWKNDQGHIVIWQMPNPWLIAWVAATFIAILLNTGTVADVLSWAGSAALIIWALLEITKGVDYFRRALGLLVLVYAVAGLIQNL